MIDLIDIFRESIDFRANPETMEIFSPTVRYEGKHRFDTLRKYKRLRMTSKGHAEEFKEYMSKIDLAHQELYLTYLRRTEVTDMFFDKSNERRELCLEHQNIDYMDAEMTMLKRTTLYAQERCSQDAISINNRIDEMIDEMIKKGIASLGRFPLIERVQRLRSYGNN